MKRVRDTSAAVFRDHIQPSLSTREQIVLEGLRDYGSEYPTSYELTEHLKKLGLVQDVNGCRPRLTRLLKFHRVALGPKRKCRITGRTAYTWLIAERPPTAQRLNFEHEESSEGRCFY